VRLRINKIFNTQKKIGYSIESEKELKGIEVDCCEGINSIVFSQKAKKAFERLSFNILREYPHSLIIKDSIIKHWKSYTSLENDRIFLGYGSMFCLRSINRLFLQSGDRVLGYVPQFVGYESDVKMWDCKYEYVSLKEDRNYKFDEDEFISHIDGNYKLIYIDNPNNPTGQVIPLSTIENIVRAAEKLDVGVILDEAYGEYMDKSNSAVTLVNRYENLICTRSFSKGYGLAGLRAGYMIVPKQLVLPMKNIIYPVEMPTVARYVAAEALNDSQFISSMRAKTCKIKSALIKEWNTLKIAETNPDVSIMMVYHPDENTDLARLFEQRKIKVVSGRYFTGTGLNSVRINMPCEKKIKIVIKAFEDIDAY